MTQSPSRKERARVVKLLRGATREIHRLVRDQGGNPEDWIDRVCPTTGYGSWTEKQREVVLDIYYRRYGNE